MEKQAEKTKKETIERILNQKGARGKREEKELRAKRVVEKEKGLKTPHCRYSSTRADGNVLAFSDDSTPHPLLQRTSLSPPVPVQRLCGAPGCQEPRAYVCSTTPGVQVPLCRRMGCYKAVKAG